MIEVSYIIEHENGTQKIESFFKEQIYQYGFKSVKNDDWVRCEAISHAKMKFFDILDHIGCSGIFNEGALFITYTISNVSGKKAEWLDGETFEVFQKKTHIVYDDEEN